MMINTLTVEKALEMLATSIDGLPEEEAKRRLHEFGPNEIEEIERRPFIYKLLEQFTVPFFLIHIYPSLSM